jgi:hypothetical protein
MQSASPFTAFLKKLVPQEEEGRKMCLRSSPWVNAPLKKKEIRTTSNIIAGEDAL